MVKHITCSDIQGEQVDFWGCDTFYAVFCCCAAVLQLLVLWLALLLATRLSMFHKVTFQNVSLIS